MFKYSTDGDKLFKTNHLMYKYIKRWSDYLIDCYLYKSVHGHMIQLIGVKLYKNNFHKHNKATKKSI